MSDAAMLVVATTTKMIDDPASAGLLSCSSFASRGATAAVPAGERSLSRTQPVFARETPSPAWTEVNDGDGDVAADPQPTCARATGAVEGEDDVAGVRCQSGATNHTFQLAGSNGSEADSSSSVADMAPSPAARWAQHHAVIAAGTTSEEDDEALLAAAAASVPPKPRDLSSSAKRVGLRVGGPRVRAPKAVAAVTTAAGFAKFAADLPRALAAGEAHMRLSDDGAGGTYFVYGSSSHGSSAEEIPVAVFKPANEEVGSEENPRGNHSTEDDERFSAGAFESGHGYVREVLAYELDHAHAAGVPQTLLVELDGHRGSLQRFCPHMMQTWSTTPAKFSVEAVQAVAAFDIRVLNGDRHGGNLLVHRDAPEIGMVPIDHGFILPDHWSDPDFEWAMWPQSRQPVADVVRRTVAAWDLEADVALVRERLGDGAADVLAVTTRLLQIALAPGKKYTMHDLAQFCRRPTLTEAAGLETLLMSCRADLDDGGDLDMTAVEAALREAFP